METEKKMHDGNLFFKHQYQTIDIEHAIGYMDSFEKFEQFYTDDLMDGNVLLRDYLYEVLERHGEKADHVSTEIGYSHDYVRKLVTGERKNPDREVILAICIYIHATVEETQNLLRYAGLQPLYARRKRDAIIWYALRTKKSLTNLNLYLDERGYTLIGKKEGKKKDK